MKTKHILFLMVLFISLIMKAQDTEKTDIANLIDNWHKAASRADQKAYFSFFADDAIYIGTDSTEIWTRDQFYQWATPYFEKGKAWNFKTNSRNIYIDETGKLAWFDELLNYGKGTLRGSGVLSKQTDGWKIRHYVLSLPVPNEKFKAVTEVLNEIVSHEGEHLE